MHVTHSTSSSLARANRLQGWRNPATVTVTPSTPDPVEVTDLALGPDDDTIWVHVSSSGTEDCPWPWSYALLTWVNSQGRELGSVKIHGVCEGEVFRLGNGLPPVERAGSIRIYPRSYNLKWVELGHPWTLDFRFQTGSSSQGSVGGVGDSTLGTFDPDNGAAPLDFALEDGFAVLLFNLFFR